MRRIVFAVLVSLAVPAVSSAPAVAQQAISEYERGLAFRMLRRVRDTLEHYYYDRNFNGRNLDMLDFRAQSAIEAATTRAEAFGAVAQFVADLGDSHTRFFPPNITVRPNYGWGWQMIGDACYVIGVDEKSDAYRKGLRRGDRVLSIDGIRPTRENVDILWYVYYVLNPKAGMSLLVEKPDGTRRDIVADAKLERLSPEVRLLDPESRRFFFNAFSGGELRHQRKTFDSVVVYRFDWFGYQDNRLDLNMGEFRRYSWLILDLRGNPGGAVEALTRFLSHFFDEPFVAYTEVRRDTTVQHKVEPGGDPFRGQVIVLIDSESASAAEITARTLQLRGRAMMVVGDRSAGAVVASIRRSLAEEASGHEIFYSMSVTVNDIIMPDGNRLEGAGVIPNVPALPTGRDLAEGRDPAMQFALEMAGVPMTAEEADRIWR